MITRLLLAGGYGLAVPLILVLRRIVRGRRLGWFLMLETGTAMIVAGWMRSRQPLPTALNAAALAGFAAWYAVGRRRPRGDTPSVSAGPTTR